MNTCPKCGMVKGMHASILPGCKCPWTPQESDCYGDGNVYRGVRSKDSFNPEWNTEAVLVEEMQRMAKRIEELEALAQPEQKYHRGDRLICLETEEYCVIHISGTDRQWVKFPDSHIGVYTNEQVAELFELLPKEPEPVAWEQFYPDIGKPKFVAQPEQEPVAWMFQHDETGRMNYVSNDGIHDPTMFLGMNPRYALVYPLYTTPHTKVACAEKFIGEAATKLQQKQETIEGLNRDYDLLFAEHQLLLKKEWIELTDEEILEVWKENEKVYPMDRSRLLDRTRACIRKAQNK